VRKRQLLTSFFLIPNAVKWQGCYGLEAEEEERIGEDTARSRQEDRAGAGARLI
jgi:hypothetical protein